MYPEHTLATAGSRSVLWPPYLKTVGDNVPRCELMAIPHRHFKKRSSIITVPALDH